MKTGKIVAIVQARMGSSRLPGKVLLQVEGRPLLGILLARLARTPSIDTVAVATSTAPADDPIDAFCANLGVPCFRSSENDVLDRFYQAAKSLGGETLVRITGDCPLLSPSICHKIISQLLDNHLDYINSGPTVAEGLDCEVFTFTALERAWREATRQTDREHMTMYIYRNDDGSFHNQTFKNIPEDSAFRVVLDEERDFHVLQRVIGHFKDKLLTVEWPEIKQWLIDHPEVMEINAKIVRNEGYLKALEKEKSQQAAQG